MKQIRIFVLTVLAMLLLSSGVHAAGAAEQPPGGGMRTAAVQCET